VESLLQARGVLAKLPAGFGKNLMFQLLVLAKSMQNFPLNVRQLLLFVRSKGNNIEQV